MGMAVEGAGAAPAWEEGCCPDPSTLLPIGLYRVVLEALEPVRLPAYAGSAWRGALGHALKRTVCVTRERACPDCLLYRSCAYPYVFETPPPPGSAKMRRYTAAPHPFVIECDGDGFTGAGRGAVPPGAAGGAPSGPGSGGAVGERPPAGSGGRVLAPGEPVTVGLTLFGRANPLLPYLVHALERAGEAGLGRSRGRLALTGVDQIDPRGGPEARIYVAGGRLDPRPVAALGPPPPPPARAWLELLTPLRLQRDGHYVGPEDLRLADLFASLLRRISMLTYFHTDSPLETDFAGLVAEARDVELDAPRLAWRDWTRYSSRQQTTLEMGGLLGEVEVPIAGRDRLWPYLWLGQWTHAGKGTSMGLGRYRIQALA